MHARAAALLAQLARGQQWARVYLSLGRWSASWLAACLIPGCCAARVAPAPTHPASERPIASLCKRTHSSALRLAAGSQ